MMKQSILITEKGQEEILKRDDLSLGSKGLYLYIKTRVQTEQLSIQREEIMRETGISLKTFYNYLNPLVEEGLISKSQRRAGGQYGNTEYSVNLTAVANKGSQSLLKRAFRNPALDLRAKAVLHYLEAKSENGAIRISWEKAKAEIKITRDTFYKAVRELSSAGYVECVAITEGKGFKKTEYRINYRDTEAECDEK